MCRAGHIAYNHSYESLLWKLTKNSKFADLYWSNKKKYLGIILISANGSWQEEYVFFALGFMRLIVIVLILGLNIVILFMIHVHVVQNNVGIMAVKCLNKDWLTVIKM